MSTNRLRHLPSFKFVASRQTALKQLVHLAFIKLTNEIINSIKLPKRTCLFLIERVNVTFRLHMEMSSFCDGGRIFACSILIPLNGAHFSEFAEVSTHANIQFCIIWTITNWINWINWFSVPRIILFDFCTEHIVYMKYELTIQHGVDDGDADLISNQLNHSLCVCTCVQSSIDFRWNHNNNAVIIMILLLVRITYFKRSRGGTACVCISRCAMTFDSNNLEVFPLNR